MKGRTYYDAQFEFFSLHIEATVYFSKDLTAIDADGNRGQVLNVPEITGMDFYVIHNTSKKMIPIKRDSLPCILSMISEESYDKKSTDKFLNEIEQEMIEHVEIPV